MSEFDYDLLAEKIVEKQAERASETPLSGGCPLSASEQRTIKEFLRTRRRALKIGGVALVILIGAAADDIWFMAKSVFAFIGKGGG